MITKAEVRAVALAALGPGIGDLVWDVGCGSGSVAIECARLGAAVVAIDDDPHAIELTTRNAATHDVPVRTCRAAPRPRSPGCPGRTRRSSAAAEMTSRRSSTTSLRSPAARSS